jgi:hypothetical protein
VYDADHDGHRAWVPLQFPDAISVELSHQGDDVPGTYDGATFTPETALLPATEYAWSVVVDADCAAVTGTFTTDELGGAVTSPEALIGRTFAVKAWPWGGDADEVHLSVFLVSFGEPWFSLRVDAIDGDAITVTLAPWLRRRPAGEPLQDSEQTTCLWTQEATGTWDGARMVLQGDVLAGGVAYLALTTSMYGYREGEGRVVLLDWTLELLVHPDGEQALPVELSAAVDTRGLGSYGADTDWSVHEGDGTAENFCTIMSEENPALACEPCEDGVVSCLPHTSFGAGAGWTAGLVTPLIDVAADQVENHLCPASCDNGSDDDGDGDVDVDEECSEGTWP